MRPFDRNRATVLEWFGPVLAAARTRGLDESAARLAAAETRLRDGKLIAVICGEFKRGKSSLLNALLEEEEPYLFPVDTMFATSIVSTVTHGPVETITATLDVGGGEVEQREITRAEIAEYVTESANPHNAKKARMISIVTPNPRLASGLTLVDTPGVGGVYAEHTAVTMGFLPAADAIVFVADATQPLAESELQFLRKAAAAVKVTEDEDGLLFVLTKIDVVDYDGILRNSKEKLAEITGRPVPAVTITPVSAHAKHAYLDGGDAEDLELSNFPELEDRVWAALSRRRTTVLLGTALAELDASAAALLQPLQSEAAALRAETPAKVAAMIADADRRTAEYERLSQDDARWRDQLRQQLTDCSKRLKVAAKERIKEIWDRVDVQYLYRQQYLDDPQLLLAAIGDEAAAVVGEISTLAARQVAEIQQQLADDSGLTIQRRRFGDLPAPSVAHVHVSGNLEKADDSWLRRGRDAAFGSGLGATVGGLVGNLILPGLGGLIGAGIGSVLGGGAAHSASVQISRKQDQKARRQSLRTELAPLRRGQPLHVEEAVEDLMSAFRGSITAELKSRVQEGKQSAKDEAARLRKAGQETKESAERRQVELRAEMVPLQRLRTDVEQMAARITEPDGSAEPQPDPDAPRWAGATGGVDVADDDWADE